MTKPVPEGFHTVTPQLVVKGVKDALSFYARAFGAEEILRMPGPDGEKVMHAEIRIGDSAIMLAEEFPDMEHRSPLALGGSPVTIHLYVEDVDASFQQAVDAGATPTMQPQDMFWGDRYCRLRDPYGHQWSIATHVEDPTMEQMQERLARLFGGGSRDS